MFLRRLSPFSVLSKQCRFYTQRNYPGSPNAKFTTDFIFKNSCGDSPFPVSQILDLEGNVINEEKMKKVDETLSNEEKRRMYSTMVKLNIMDDILYNAQRQGRISFYMTNYGEEATQVGSVSALNPDDEIYAQYREAGVLMHRGFTLDDFMNQNFSTKHDYGKGRQMPVHYGTAKLHFQTVSSPLTTQVPQAAGAGYAFKLEGKNRICICYFGDGAASEGDFHAGLNFAATLESRTLFFCRNNAYAISTPVTDQYRGDGIVARGLGYGINSIRVDGNDIFAVYLATKMAREAMNEKNGPYLIEAMTYRAGHHSTSDDASRYRSDEELKYWRDLYNPIERFKKYLLKNKLLTIEEDAEMRKVYMKEVLAALARAEKAEKTPLSELFNDVYHNIPKHLQEQKMEIEEHVQKYPEYYSKIH